MASNLLGLRKAAGYKSAGDFAEAHGIPVSTYARYESNPDKIPMERAWQLADIFGTTIDAVVGRQVPAPGVMRGEVQLEYDGLTRESRALADEFREFVRMKDAKIRERRRHEEETPFDALCYQYERQMLAEMGEGNAFGELVVFESEAEARETFRGYLERLAIKKRGGHPTKIQQIADNATIDKVMEAYDRIHSDFAHDGISMMWNAENRGISVEYSSAPAGGGGDAKR
ncbi:helix-turn-helix domain-containing protein [Collinsella intestinalis]|uniref:helix-turn-helix domain-containing protein n=1 Tax=Collinsella intestinalis TaxID=147207 RepID=UPI001958B499|nr:helix-turn-helix transcriptional regulator [Collinsella intestinalis]MBM6942622.1 helix-turn-helix transcriptional regulator [Collinsella intestinalis]